MRDVRFVAHHAPSSDDVRWIITFARRRRNESLLLSRGVLIIRRVIRRLHVSHLQAGDVALDADESHHARDVLRLTVGTIVELFNDAGQTARGTIATLTKNSVIVRVESLDQTPGRATHTAIVVASALPKGDRADWMIEKLSELGVDQFIPLVSARSVVVPKGTGKAQRWTRIAVESAKQSRRAGVMQIATLATLGDLLSREKQEIVLLSTEWDAKPLHDLLQSKIDSRKSQITLLIGPEGGWTPEELKTMKDSALTAARLTATILRIETAAIAAAAIVAAWRDAADTA